MRRRPFGRFERDVMRHMLLWDPHGPLYDEDIYPAFGLNVRDFHQRFADIVSSSRVDVCFDDGDRELLDEARRYFRQQQEKC
jgi:hypothetical protein